jgi:glycosyltransferase involved in cell wall biosynthesis
MNEQVLYLSLIDWDFIYQRPQQIAHRLAQRGLRTLYVDSTSATPILRTKLSEKPSCYQIEMGMDFPLAIRQHRWEDGNPKMRVVRAVTREKQTWSISRIAREGGLDLSSAQTSLRAAMQGLSMDKPIIWTNFPYWLPVIQSLPHSQIVYDCLDNYQSFKGTHDAGDFERELLDASDVVFAVSNGLVNRCRERNPNTFLIPNGADVQHFAATSHEATPIAPDIADVPHPILGYVGYIGQWFDVDLAQKLAAHRRDWSVVLIGPIESDLQPQMNALAAAYPNLYLFGGRPYPTLPTYLKAMDVCLILLKLTEITMNGSQLKMYEYLAAGKPVISTPLHDVVRFEPLVYTAGDPELFCQKVETALSEDGAMTNERCRIAAQHSWDARCDEMLRRISESANQKNPQTATQ